MHDDTTLTAFERRVADELDRYSRGVVDTRSTMDIARTAIAARPRARNRWSSRNGRLILVAAVVASATLGIIGVGGSRPSVAILPSPSPTPTPSLSPTPTPASYPLEGSPGLVVYHIGNIDDSAAEIHLVGLDGSNDHVVATDVSAPRHEQPEWTPDGTGFTFLVSPTFADGRDIWRYDLATGRSALLVQCVEPCVDQESVAMSPEQTRLVFFVAERPIDDVVVDGTTTQIPGKCWLRITQLVGAAAPVDLKPTTCGLVEYRYPRWSPTSDRIAVIRTRQDVRGGPVVGTDLLVIDPATSAETLLASRPDDALSGLDWSPDGQWIAFTDGTSVRRVGPDGTIEEELVAPGKDQTTHPRYLKDGSRITYVVETRAKASGGSKSEGDVIDVSPWIVDAAGGTPIKFLPYGTFTNWMSVQPVP
jgi:Tol biopolymer transport system component